MEAWTVKKVLDWIEGYLSQHGCENARLSAQWLVADTLGCSRLELYTDLARPLTEQERDILRDYTKRRAAGEPLQYITGSTDFRFLTLAVEPGVLIPRPETEVLVSEALAELGVLDHPVLVLDLCTGSGNVALSIASEISQAHVIAVDISPEACALASRNAQTLGLTERIDVIESDLCEALPADVFGQVQLLVSNPPYIPTEELAHLGSEVADFEPRLALDGGADGLVVFRRILDCAQELLCPGGILAVELHETTLDAAAHSAIAHGFENVRIAQDLADKPRVLIAHAPCDVKE